MNDSEKIDRFLAQGPFAVVGASTDRSKYGNKVLRVYRRQGSLSIRSIPAEIEGLRCYPDLASLPEPVHGVSIITPPPVTEKVVEEAAAAGIRHVWMQPGAESPQALRRAEELGLETIAGGPCVLVVLGYHE